jgi:predicted transcriptional regulator of viral defense system
VFVPLELAELEQVIPDPWILAPVLFDECYIAGVSAAHYWELTEQLFNEIFVCTKRRTPRSRTTQGITFVLKRVDASRFFGLKSIWHGGVRISVSDPARTIIDMLAMPEIGGGIDHTTECLSTYLRTTGSENLLIEYAERFGNGALFKRLGYLASSIIGNKMLADACMSRLTEGFTKLDPNLPRRKLNTSWRVWVP